MPATPETITGLLDFVGPLRGAPPRRGGAEHHLTRRSDRLQPLSHPHLLTNRGVTNDPEPISPATPDPSSAPPADPHRRALAHRPQAASPTHECPAPPDKHELPSR